MTIRRGFPSYNWPANSPQLCMHRKVRAEEREKTGLNDKLQENPQSFVRDAAILKQWSRDNAMGPGALHWKIAITHGRGVCKSGRIKLPRRKSLSALVSVKAAPEFSVTAKEIASKQKGVPSTDSNL